MYKAGIPPHYVRWRNMRLRCQNPTSSKFKNYGGRGITVCKEWEDFRAFQQWCFAHYEEAESLERVDNDGPYAPSNCRFATPHEQNRNRRLTQESLCSRKQNLLSAQKALRSAYGDPQRRSHKVCRKCKQRLPLERFSKDKASVDGIRYTCRPCVSAERKVLSVR